MNHNDHIFLLRKGVPDQGGTWADFGSGGGAFTLALADLIGRQGHIYSVDKDRGSLREQERALRSSFPNIAVEYIAADFTQRLQLPPLDGIVMANSLHFVRNKRPVLETIREMLKPGGRLVLVEYGSDRGNPWVPHPISFDTWSRTAEDAGFVGTVLLHTVPSRYFGSMYSAVSRRPAT